MRVCILADKWGNLDEGMKKVGSKIAEILKTVKEIDDILYLDVHSLVTNPFLWRRIKQFEPDIIHFIPGVSVKSLSFMKLLKLRLRSTKSIISALIPRLDYPKILIRFLKPDLLIVQSEYAIRKLSALGVNFVIIPNGVDIDKFKPVDTDMRISLREKYGIPTVGRVILHVGHLKEGRNIHVLPYILSEDDVLLIVGSTTTKVSKKLIENLSKYRNVIIRREYFKNIEEIYALADVYVFPVKNERNSIGVPLSVLEAMSTNLPVITTRFGGLPLLFREGNGYYYFDTLRELKEKIQLIFYDSCRVKTRDMVAKYSWNRIGQLLVGAYKSIL